MLFQYHLIGLSNFNVNPEARQLVGDSVIYFLYTILLYKAIFIIIEWYKQAKKFLRIKHHTKKQQLKRD